MKNSGLAAVLSFFVPGLGQIYNGQIGTGLLFFFGTAIGFLFLVVPGIVLWIYGIYHAYKNAEAINRKEVQP